MEENQHNAWGQQDWNQGQDWGNQDWNQQKAKIPYEVFAWERNKRKEAEGKMSDMQSQIDELKNSRQTWPEHDYENLTKDDLDKARAHERKIAEQEFQKQQAQKEAALEKEASEVKENMELYKAQGLKFDEDKLLEMYDKVWDIDKAMDLYKEYEMPNYEKSLENQKQTDKTRLKQSENNSDNRGWWASKKAFIPWNHSFWDLAEMWMEEMRGG